jgi:hypothetical protein
VDRPNPTSVGRIRRQIGANVVEGWSDPGTINLTPPGVEEIWEASASSRAAVVVIRPEFLSRAIEEHWGADSSKVEYGKLDALVNVGPANPREFAEVTSTTDVLAPWRRRPGAMPGASRPLRA